MSETKDKDLGYKAILREMDRAHDAFVDVGYWGAKTHPNDNSATIPYIASVHEYGTKPGTEPQIPERSFIRAAMDEHSAELATLTARLPLLSYSGVYDLVQTLKLEGRITMNGVVVRVVDGT